MSSDGEAACEAVFRVGCRVLFCASGEMELVRDAPAQQARQLPIVFFVDKYALVLCVAQLQDAPRGVKAGSLRRDALLSDDEAESAS